ncbi:hypothetical protein [Nonomuraea turcica]|uniref:hypothetical protein n=1 Tax=Nonomuraea sp. G32 TaxID=3067274 RepID=UPI00273C874A|nr:hypothetical protein [Nonomuraea sp. G32]MDP4511293.1 hypothetical protein [Nonomuraea sp. G32]
MLPALVTRMADLDDDVRSVGVHLVAVAGNPAHADALAAALADRSSLSARLPGTVGDIAVWGLARLGDPRCVAPLVEHITRAETIVGYSSNHYGADFYWVELPGIHEVLALVPQYAADLLPVVRARLRDASSLGERRALCQAITAWGPMAAGVVPELIELLDSDAAEWAAEALAAAGPAAASAQAGLRRLALDAPAAPSVRETAAWAVWKVCADPEPALGVLGTGPRTGGLGSGVQRLADLGPAAGPRLPSVRELLDGTDDWTRVRAAHAVWAISGELDLVVPILREIVLPLGEGRMLPVRRAAVRKIGPRAASVVPILQRALATDRRLSHESGWRAIHGDEEFRDEIRHTVDRIGRSATEEETRYA